MQYQHNSLTYSKGLLLGRKVKMYKHLAAKLLPEDDQDTPPPPPEGGTTPTSQAGATPKVVHDSTDLHYCCDVIINDFVTESTVTSVGG